MKLLLCEKCNNYYFDGGCKSPSVIDAFGNFYRRYKCKYYRKIKYKRLIFHCRQILRQLIYGGRRRAKYGNHYYPLSHYLWEQEKYFLLKDLLFQIIQYEGISE